MRPLTVEVDVAKRRSSAFCSSPATWTAMLIAASRVALQDRHQVLARDRDGRRRLERLHRRRAAVAGEQRQLADDRALADLRERDRLAVGQPPRQLHLAAVDHVAGVAAVALGEDHRARLPGDGVDLARQRVELLVRQRGEQVEPVEQVDDRVVWERQVQASFPGGDPKPVVGVIAGGLGSRPPLDHPARPIRCVRHACPVLVGSASCSSSSRRRLIGRGVEDKVQPSLLFIPGTESTHWRDVRKGSFNESLIVLLVGPRQRDRPSGPAAGGRARTPRRDACDLAVERPRRQAARGAAPQPDARRRSASTCGSRRAATSTRSSGRSKTSSTRTSTPPVRAHLAGIPSLGSEVNKSSIDALHKGELIAAPILILVLLLVFRSPVAAAIPLLIAAGHGRHGLRDHLADPQVRGPRCGRAQRGVDARPRARRGLLAADRHALQIEPRRGPAPRQAASIAANTAGRTANFAGVVLLVITVVAFFMSPGTILLSMAIGMSVVTVLSMIGAILVAPGRDEPARPPDQQVADRRRARRGRRHDLPDRRPGEPPRGARRGPARGAARC